MRAENGYVEICPRILWAIDDNPVVSSFILGALFFLSVVRCMGKLVKYLSIFLFLGLLKFLKFIYKSTNLAL